MTPSHSERFSRPSLEKMKVHSFYRSHERERERVKFASRGQVHEWAQDSKHGSCTLGVHLGPRASVSNRPFGPSDHHQTAANHSGHGIQFSIEPRGRSLLPTRILPESELELEEVASAELTHKLFEVLSNRESIWCHTDGDLGDFTTPSPSSP